MTYTPPNWLQETFKRAKEGLTKLPPKYRPRVQLSKPKCEPRLGGPHNMYIVGTWHVEECTCEEVTPDVGL